MNGFPSRVTLRSSFHWIVLVAAVLEGCSTGPQVSKQQIDQARKAYMTQEGHQARGAKFSELALMMDSATYPGKHASGRLYTQKEIIDLLGPPDLVRHGKSETEFAYFHDRFGKRDWAVYVSFSKSDPYAEFGYNASDVRDHSMWEKFNEANAPPAGTGDELPPDEVAEPPMSKGQ